MYKSNTKGVLMKQQKPGLREILSSAVFIIIIGALFALNLIIPAPEVLLSERRVPAKFPELSLNTVASGSFMSKFGDYASDRFVFRDGFRSINAFMMFDVYMMSDKSGLYRSDLVGAGEFRRTNETSFRQSAERIKRAADGLDGLDMNIYYSIVPDKSIFAENYMPGFDIEAAESILFDVLGGYEYISLTESLRAGDFYKTDLHWDQVRIKAAADHLLSAMGAGGTPDELPVVRAGEFRGVFAGQLALPMGADTMSYTDVGGLKVSYLDEKTLEFGPGPVYEIESFPRDDPYDLFLRGPQPLIVIENEAAPGRELFVFRDSFGSSLGPLLCGSYSKVTLIDLRYIHMMMLGQFIEFTPGSDVLFIYSSQIFNNPSVLLA